MTRQESLDTLGFAIDESNHGRDREVFVMICSHQQADLEIIKAQKRRRVGKQITEEDFLRELFERDFRYLEVDKKDYKVEGQRGLLIQVAKKLIVPFKEYVAESPIALYVDGALTMAQNINLSAGLAKKLGTHPSMVGVHQMPKTRDPRTKRYQTIPLLNLADTTANYIFRQLARGETLDPRIRGRELHFR